MSRYIDGDKLLSSFKNSYLAACKWEEEAKDEEIKARANSARATFLECYLRTKEMPTADVEEVRHGRWITWAYPGDEHVECSECHTQYYENDLYLGGNEFPKRCPECGAHMDKEKEEDG